MGNNISNKDFNHGLKSSNVENNDTHNISKDLNSSVQKLEQKNLEFNDGGNVGITKTTKDFNDDLKSSNVENNDTKINTNNISKDLNSSVQKLEQKNLEFNDGGNVGITKTTKDFNDGLKSSNVENNYTKINTNNISKDLNNSVEKLEQKNLEFNDSDNVGITKITKDFNDSSKFNNIKNDTNHTLKDSNEFIQMSQQNIMKPDNQTHELNDVDNKTIQINNHIKSNFNYEVVIGSVLLILIIFVVILKKRRKQIPLLSEQKKREHDESFFQDCLEKKDWETMKDILDDPTFSADIKKRAIEYLKNANV